MKFEQMHRNFINLSTCIAMLPVVLEPTKIYNISQNTIKYSNHLPRRIKQLIFFTVNLSSLLFDTEFIHNPM